MFFRRLKNLLNGRVITGTLTSTIMILGVAWFIADRDYEPAIAALTGIAAFVGLFKFSFLSFDKNLAADRIALVVGNDSYPQLGELPAVRRDVEAVCRSMEAKGFKIIKKINPSTLELRKAVYDFQTILSTGGVGLFYYAGHAAQIEGRDLIVPVDRETTTPEAVLQNALNLNDLLGPVDKIIEDSPEHNGSLVIYATAAGGIAIDHLGGDHEHSPFARAFLELVERWNLEIFDLFRLLCRKVSQATESKQVPWLAASLDTEFYFKPIIKERVGVLKLLVFDACRTNPFFRTRYAHIYEPDNSGEDIGAGCAESPR